MNARDRTVAARRGRPTRWRLAAAALLASAGVAGCDLLMTDPAPAAADVEVSFQIAQATPGGSATAFARVNRVGLTFMRADQSQRDTILPVLPINGTIRAGVALQSDERISALGIGARLAAGPLALFEGAAIVQIVPGVPTTANIPLTPIANRLVGAPAALSLPGAGATAQMTSSVLFATGDTIDGLQGLWTSENPTIVTVTPTGLATAVRLGQTRLVVARDTLADTIPAQVVPPTAAIRR